MHPHKVVVDEQESQLKKPCSQTLKPSSLVGFASHKILQSLRNVVVFLVLEIFTPMGMMIIPPDPKHPFQDGRILERTIEDHQHRIPELYDKFLGIFVFSCRRKMEKCKSCLCAYPIPDVKEGFHHLQKEFIHVHGLHYGGNEPRCKFVQSPTVLKNPFQYSVL